MVEGMQPVEAGLRYGIFGTWEFIFPKESMHDVLTFLKFNQKVEGFTEHDWISNLKVELKIKTMQKVMGLDKIPEFNISKGMLCPDDLFEGIRIIPLGVRYDKSDFEFPNGLIHEAV